MEQQKMTDKELSQELKGNKAAATVAKIIGGCIVAAALICVITGQIILAVILFIIGAAVSSVKDKKNAAMKKQMGDNLVKEALEAVFDEVEYDPFGSVGTVQIRDSGVILPLGFRYAEGNDHVRAVYKGLHIEFSDVTLVEEEDIFNEEMQVWENKKRNVFKGQWMICDLGRELSAWVSLFPRTGFQRLIRTDTIKTGNEAFDKHFTVRSDDGERVFHILTPHAIEYILSAAEQSGGKLYMSFQKEGRLHIVLESNKDFFELDGGPVNVDRLREKFKTQVKWFTDMIDEMRLADKLYK